MIAVLVPHPHIKGSDFENGDNVVWEWSEWSKSGDVVSAYWFLMVPFLWATWSWFLSRVEFLMIEILMFGFVWFMWAVFKTPDVIPILVAQELDEYIIINKSSSTRFPDNSYCLPLIDGQTRAKLMKMVCQPGGSCFEAIYQLDSQDFFDSYQWRDIWLIITHDNQ